jgi:hypothetical protein
LTFTYDADGSRVPFDPNLTGRQLAGCFLCGRRVVMVGVFMPTTDDMRAVVLRLRQHSVPARTTSAFAYGLCHQHAADIDATSEQVEAALVAAAAHVVTQ